MKNLALALLLLGAAGCQNIHRMMLNVAIEEFSQPVSPGTQWKLWLTGPDDPCANTGGGVASGLLDSVLPGTGALTGAVDGLAVEVFTNYLTASKRGRVIEKHRANYWTDLKVETRLYEISEIEDKSGKRRVVSGTFEDLCILDEAKKRNADKVLAFEIVRVTDVELDVHLRLSDVGTGLVELSRTLAVRGLNVKDIIDPLVGK